MNDPSTLLVTPVAQEIVPDFIDRVLRAPDWLSPSHWLFWIVEQLGGANLSADMAKFAAGDWSVVGRASDALTHLGNFTTAAANGIREDARPLDAAWDGYAADAAQSYFAHLATVLGEMEKELDRMSADLRETAFGIKSVCEAIASSIEALYDVVIALNVEAACAIAGAETVVISLICGGIGLITAAEGVRLVLAIGEGWGKAMLLADAVGGIIAASLGTLQSLHAVRMPGSYVNEGIPAS
ncbi:MAG: hypothetical protein KBF43_02160 [Dermatophilaceae bacterium]|jgi:uncharacterized protein YukE|nr:hypothetical protein [Dermatophilaceae bacterium]MBP9917375.1 hypothetical protein [Dermatophilaceae bacterium]